MSYFKGPDIHDVLKNYQPSTSVLKILVDSLRNNEERYQLIDGDTGASITAGEFLQQSRAIAAGLQEHGITAGELVVLCCDKSILAFSLFLGTMLTGATALLIPFHSVSKIDQLTSGNVVKAVFYGAEFQEPVSQSLSRMTVCPSLVGVVEPEDSVIASLLKTTRPLEVYQVQDVTEHVPVVLFTSGTTGIPKGVQLSDRSVQLSSFYVTETSEKYLNPSPFFWYSSLTIFMDCTSNGRTMVITNSKDAKSRLQVVEKYKVDTMFASVSNMIQFINEPDLRNCDLSSINQVLVGGELVLPSVIRRFVLSRFLKKEVSYRVLYGSTECGVTNSVLLDEKGFLHLKLGECGKPCPGVELKVTDAFGKTVEIGTLGRILAKTLALKGYWNSQSVVENFVDQDGFYDTGDVGLFDNEGNLFLRGRRCDLINYKGIKISPVEIEDLLMAHPAVKEAAVVGKAHESDIQHLTAFIVSRTPGVSEQEIADYVNGKVGDSLKLRGGVHFITSLPRVTSGKITRKLLQL